MSIILSILVAYMVGGVIYVIKDFKEPLINQPTYVRQFDVKQILFMLIAWAPRLTVFLIKYWRYRRPTINIKMIMRHAALPILIAIIAFELMEA